MAGVRGNPPGVFHLFSKAGVTEKPLTYGKGGLKEPMNELE
jgi:hypothetical protein